MKYPRSSRRVVASCLTCALAFAVVLAQQPRTPTTTRQNNAAQQETTAAVTLDTMFAADSYAVYGEMRDVGQFVSSEEIKQMLEPLHLPGMIPSQATDLLDFLRAHAEPLANARLAFAAMPAEDELPEVVAAVEMSSPEDAQKLEPQMRKFLADYYAAHPEIAAMTTEAQMPPDTRAGAARTSATLGASPVTTGTVGARGASRRAQSPAAQNARAGEGVAEASKSSGEAAAPIFIRRSGALLAFADRQFTFKKLRGGAAADDARLLLNSRGFQAARAQLSRDTLFLYFNTTLMSRSVRRQQEEIERQQKLAEEEMAREEQSAANANSNAARRSAALMNANVTVANTNVAESNTNAGGNSNNAAGDKQSPDEPDLDPLHGVPPQERAQIEADLANGREEAAKAAKAEEEEEAKRRASPEYAEQQRKAQRRREFNQQMDRIVFGAGPTGGTWAESIGVGLSLENDELVARALFVSDSPDRPLRPVPFVPVMLSGPPLAPEAASVLPADADIYASASLDLPQMYDYVASVFKIFDMAAQASGEQDKQGLFESQVSAFERENKFRIREDLLGSLGNEIAVCLPAGYLGVRRGDVVAPGEAGEQRDDSRAAEPPPLQTSPVFVISLNDKKAVRELLPRALAAVGIQGVGEQQLIEKRGDVELINFTNGSAAFIDRFLVISDPPTMRWVADAYNRRQTLANSDEFRRATAWQPRLALGQIYVSNALLKGMFSDARRSLDDIEDPELRNFIARLDENPGAVTHAVTKEGDGLMHELHVPKNLLALASASFVVAEKTAEQRVNEARARSALYNIFGREQEYKEKYGRFATLNELEAELKNQREGDRTESPFKSPDYEIKLSLTADGYEATATPTGYPKKGRRSFFINEKLLLRGGDTGGKPATAASKPINY
ncbi:MAG: hypothetical protein ABR563_09640 [Pyrinomonadaceae bacterium]